MNRDRPRNAADFLAADFLAYFANRLRASDPALDRWRSGLRALLTAGIAAGAFVPLTRWLGLEYKLSLAGIVVPMMAVVALQDPGRAAQKATMAWMPPLAGATLVVGTLAGTNPWLSGALFLVTIFLAFEARRYGPRGAGLGTIAYQSFFYALLFQTPPGQAPWLPLFVFIGCAIAYVVHFHLVPEHPGRLLDTELRAWRARIDALRHDLARRLEQDGAAARRSAARIDSHLAAMNAQARALDARLAGFARRPDETDGLRDRIVRAELAAETVASVVRGAADADADARAALAQGLRSGAAIAPLSLPETARWRLAQATHTLACTAPWHAPLPALRDERQPPPQAVPAAPARGRRWFDATTRRALQACAAALGAMLAGRAISPSHWYWAVFAAFIVFTRAGTVGQTLSGAWRQLLASVAGLCLGVVVAAVAQDSRNLELGLLFAFVACGFYAFRGMQNLYTVLLTAMLAMLYELMGMNSKALLALRLVETTAGALSAVLAARLVLPVHTNDASDDKAAALLRAAGRLLDAALADPPLHGPLHAALNALDGARQALRQALGPVVGSAYPASKAGRRRHLDRLSRIAYCMRHFYSLAADGRLPVHMPAYPAAAHVLRARLDGVALMLEAPQRPAPPPPGLARLAALDAAAIGAGAAGAPACVAAQLLAEADALLRALQDELAAPAR